MSKDKPHGFCETPHENCTINYCDENGCMNRKRNLVGEPIEISNDKQSIHPREMKYIWSILKDSFVLKMICSIFDHDAHHIVSKKGWKKLKP